MQDISNSADVELLVKTFYSNLLLNEDVKPIFEHVDFEKHMPHMIAFWEFVLLDKEGKIIAKNLRGVELEKAIEKALSQK